MTQTILVYGNCQAGVYADMLRNLSGSTRAVRYLMSFNHPTEAQPRLTAEDFETCTLVLEQVDAGNPMRSVLGRDAPSRAKVVRFPPLDCNLLWPFNFSDPRNVSEPPDYPFGRFPYGDRIVVELIRQGVEGPALWEAYQERSIARLPDMRRLRVHEEKRMAARDAKSDIKVAPLIMSELASRRLFWTIDHPTGWLLGKVFGEILDLCRDELGLSGDVRAEADRMFSGFEPFGHQAVPIHPEVARQLALSWCKPDERYRYLDGSTMSFDETMRRYIDFR